MWLALNFYFDRIVIINFVLDAGLNNRSVGFYNGHNGLLNDENRKCRDLLCLSGCLSLSLSLSAWTRNGTCGSNSSSSSSHQIILSHALWTKGRSFLVPSMNATSMAPEGMMFLFHTLLITGKFCMDIFTFSFIFPDPSSLLCSVFASFLLCFIIFVHLLWFHLIMIKFALLIFHYFVVPS